jgi:hypothetical protein
MPAWTEEEYKKPAHATRAKNNAKVRRDEDDNVLRNGAVAMIAALCERGYVSSKYIVVACRFCCFGTALV